MSTLVSILAVAVGSGAPNAYVSPGVPAMPHLCLRGRGQQEGLDGSKVAACWAVVLGFAGADLVERLPVVCGQLGLGSAHRVAGIACGALFPRQGSMVVGMLGMLVGGCAPGGLQRNLNGGDDGRGAMKTQVLSPAHLGWCPGKWCSWPRQLVPVGSHFGFHLLPGRGWLGRCGQQVCWP